MDLLMPVIDGIEATRRIKAAPPEVEVVALTSFIEEDRVVGAIEAGASGFLLKDAEADDAGRGDPRGGRRRGPPGSGGRRHRGPSAARPAGGGDRVVGGDARRRLDRG